LLAYSRRQSIIDGKLDVFVQEFMRRQFPNKDSPRWVQEALASAGIAI
jgi:hypothetical protein